MKPKLLDLFCCAGGASRGYHRAGFDVVGVDIKPRPNYPFTFIQGNALDVLADLNESGDILEYQAIHASPPCQKECYMTWGTNKAKGWGREHVQLIPTLRELLENSSLPYIIEQPGGNAPVIRHVTLCGEYFGLGVIRHRSFELGRWTAVQPVHLKHRGRVRGWRHGIWVDGPYIAAYGSGGGKGTVPEMQAAMGIDWTDVREELTEAIPPAYAEHLGKQLITQLA